MSKKLGSLIEQLHEHCKRFLEKTHGNVNDDLEVVCGALDFYIQIFLQIQGVCPSSGDYDSLVAEHVEKFWRGYLTLNHLSGEKNFLTASSHDIQYQMFSLQRLAQRLARGESASEAECVEMTESVIALSEMCEVSNLTRFGVCLEPATPQRLTNVAVQEPVSRVVWLH